MEDVNNARGKDRAPQSSQNKFLLVYKTIEIFRFEDEEDKI